MAHPALEPDCTEILPMTKVRVRISEQVKKWFYFATGQPILVDAKVLTAERFDKFANEGNSKASRRPVILFFLFMFVLLWLMSKSIQRLQQKQMEASAANWTGGVSIKELEFCKALFDFIASSPAELSLKKGDIVALLDPVTQEASKWWRGRLRTR
ncbi:hypothetical protein BC830DRAFT_1083080 [Chytriomyces sp. MP71]|nr:hypothetical protein BC830DRAFT_1083080 [Chytriomyces sp. MP71]